MEASLALSFSPPNAHLVFNILNPAPPSPSNGKPFYSFYRNFRPKLPKVLTFSPPSKNSFLLSPPYAVATLETTTESCILPKGAFSKVDKAGKFHSPRAARELALLIAYSACLEGSDPVFLLDKRVNAKKVPGYVFDKNLLLEYDHMSFSGEPVQVKSEEEAEELMQKNEKDSKIEGEVLSAPPKLVYNKFVLRLARDLLGAVVNQWDEHVLVIDKIIPQNWKDEPTARILELSILHLAMAEITAIGTKHQIVINESCRCRYLFALAGLFPFLVGLLTGLSSNRRVYRPNQLLFPPLSSQLLPFGSLAVDLTKRFCDGSAPRIINGCLRTFIKTIIIAE